MRFDVSTAIITDFYLFKRRQKMTIIFVDNLSLQSFKITDFFKWPYISFLDILNIGFHRSLVSV